MIRRALYRLGSIAGPMAELRRRYELLLESQHWSPEKLAARRRPLLRDLLDHAARTVPYYRSHWAERGVSATAAADPDRLGEWPILGKEELRDRFSELASEAAHPRAYEYATGGSTGKPVKLLIDPEVKGWRWAAKMRNLAWIGWQPGDRIAFIWGSDYDQRRTARWQTRIFRRASNQVWLNTFAATEAEYVRFARFLARWRPSVLVGYASSLLTFREVCEAHGDLRGALSFHGVQSSAEVLHEENKEKLRAAFDCAVYDLYGQREVGNVAQNSVDRGPLLINVESLVVETIETDDLSRIVITDLRNSSFPIIRYDTGDLGRSVAVPETETRSLPALGPIAGRRAEMLRAPNGRLVHCEYFAHAFYGLDAVKQFQLVVKPDDRLLIRYVAGPGADIDRVLRAVQRDIDPSWDVRAERVDRIPAMASGKHCYVVHEPHEHA